MYVRLGWRFMHSGIELYLHEISWQFFIDIVDFYIDLVDILLRIKIIDNLIESKFKLNSITCTNSMLSCINCYFMKRMQITHWNRTEIKLRSQLWKMKEQICLEILSDLNIIIPVVVLATTCQIWVT